MKHEAAIREILISNTIHLVAEGGFEKATTRAIITSNPQIDPEIHMNEIYIYRLFGGKAQLYEAAFNRLDHELVVSLHACIHSVGGLTPNTKTQLYQVFRRVWWFVLSNEDYCRCYIRYYYSVYFKDGSRRSHNHLFADVIEDFASLFREGTNVSALMHSVFTTILDFAIRVYNGDLQDSDANRGHVFNMLYSSILSYVKPELIQPNKS